MVKEELGFYGKLISSVLASILVGALFAGATMYYLMMADVKFTTMAEVVSLNLTCILAGFFLSLGIINVYWVAKATTSGKSPYSKYY